MGRNLDPEFHRFAHRHRVELVNAYNPTSAKEHAGRFRGDDFTAAQGYEGPGEGVGNRIIPMSFYGPPRGFDDRPTAWEKSDAWMKFLQENFPEGPDLPLHARRTQRVVLRPDQSDRRKRSQRSGAGR